MTAVPETTTTITTQLQLFSSDDETETTDPIGSNRFDRRTILLGVGGSMVSSFAVTTMPQNAMAATADSATAAAGSTNHQEFPTMGLPNSKTNVRMPVLALNTVGLSQQDTTLACELAAANGFRHFDFHPGQERDGVAKFLAATNTNKRSDFFLTTKIRKPPLQTTPEEAEAMARRQIDEDLAAFAAASSNANNKPYFDMLMIRDSPDCAVMRAQWKVLEEALRDGTCRSIGVVNFCEESLRCLLQSATTKPAVNYYYYHIGMNTGRAYKLREFCDRKKIKTFAYGAVGEPGPYTDERILTSPILKTMGDASKVYNFRNHGPGDKSPEEIAIKWVVETGAAVSVRPTTNYGLGKSVCSNANDDCKLGIETRAGIFDWDLTGEEIYKLTNIPALKSEDNPTLFSSAGCPGERAVP